MFKFKDFEISAVIVAYAAIINISGVENVIFNAFTESSMSIDVLRNERNEVLKLVELKEFTEVDKMLSGMQRNSAEFEMIIEDIVKKINQSEISFEYAIKTSVPEINCLILKNLWIGKNSTNDTNLFQTMDIYKAFNSKVIQNEIVGNESMKSLGCKIFEEEIRTEIQNKSVSILKSFVLAEDFNEIATIDFVDRLSNTSEEILEYVNKMVIDQSYKIFPIHKLFSRTILAGNYTFPWNVFTVLNLLSKNVIILNGDILDLLIPFLLFEQKIEYEKNNNLTDYTKNKFTQFFDFFSSYDKTLHLSKNVCFRNYISKEYICRSSIETKRHDIGLCTERSSKTFWKIDFINAFTFHIEDSNNTKQLMYISETETDVVHVGTSSGYKDWSYSKKGNAISIYNMGSRDYLCLSENKSEISLMANEAEYYDKCHWLVEDCESHLNI